MDVTSIPPRGLRISGDGSRVFCVDDENIQAWSIQTGVPTGRASLRSKHPYLLDPLWIDGLKVLVHCEESSTLSLDFGIPGPTPTEIVPTSSNRPHLYFIGGTCVTTTELVGIEDRVTGKVVFPFESAYGKPSAIQWDGNYLIAGFRSGEDFVLDFSHMLL